MADLYEKLDSLKIEIDKNQEETDFLKELEEKIGLGELLYLLDSEFNIRYEDVSKFKVDHNSIETLKSPKYLIREYDDTSKLDILTDTPFDKTIGNLFKGYQIEIYFCRSEDIARILDPIKRNNKLINNEEKFKLDDIINIGIRLNCSDIHLEVFEDEFRIRYRVDGNLVNKFIFNKGDYNRINNKIKNLAKMDISNRLTPQDGYFRWRLDSIDYDVRVSSLPTIFGEKLVLRLLINKFINKEIKELGMDEKALAELEVIVSRDNGMLIVTGPTGSGKTTTMYSVLNKMNIVSKNIVTIEDPIEYKIPGINQIQVNLKSGLDFSNGLKSILRQDPDIIMIGEMRDRLTAQIGIRASITGHLVLSTLHTNNSHSAILRLLDLGIEEYLIGDGLSAVISQRLIRSLCNNCKELYYTDEYLNRLLGLTTNKKLYRPKGCSKCNNGYIGRVGVFELLKVNRKLVNRIVMGQSLEEIRSLDVAEGFHSLEEKLRELLFNGVISYEDLIKTGFI